jgi:hypothetical protein
MYYKIQNENQMFIFDSNKNMWIPMDYDNSDYNIFLKYLEQNDLTLDDISIWVK